MDPLTGHEKSSSTSPPTVRTSSWAGIANWCWFHLLTSVALAFSLASWWGLGGLRRLVRRSNGGPEADGEGGSAAAAGLHAAHPLPTVLSREERACTRDAFNHQWHGGEHVSLAGTRAPIVRVPSCPV